MTKQAKLSAVELNTEDEETPPAESPVSPENAVDESRQALQRSDAASGRTYTVAGLLQAHVRPRSLGSYVKGG
jgi:hypothetical protein